MNGKVFILQFPESCPIPKGGHKQMEFRKIFDTIPEKFDRWRPQYCEEAFAYLKSNTGLNEHKSLLEIGPGTGQATKPLLDTGCDYLAIELGEHLAAFTAEKFKDYPNFHLVNDDFITHDFGNQKFDVVFSAATIQWIPEEIAYQKTYNLLKPGGTLAMMLNYGDYKTPNEALYQEIQEIYNSYFRPERPYTQKFDYLNAPSYGFTDVEKQEFHSSREFTAEEYIEYLGTHCDHIEIDEPYRSKFFDGIKAAILKHQNRIEFQDTIILYLTQKLSPEDSMNQYL